MNELVIMTIVKKALITGVTVGGPILIISLVVGLIISIFQATTQIQEQTLTFVPKLIAIILVFQMVHQNYLKFVSHYYYRQ